MKTLKTLKCGDVTVSLNPYRTWPKTNDAAPGYCLEIDGVKIERGDALALTGGGIFPVYTYLRLDGEIYWIAARFDGGTKLVTPTPAAAPVEGEVPAPKKAGKK